MTDDALVRIAGELYAGPLASFIAERNARAKDEDDPALSAAISAFRKPSLAAWVVNVFARERPDELGEALTLAAELRDAQADLDAPALAKLGRERRALTRRLAQEASELATARGGRITAATLDAVQQTISSAFFDEGASTAVASGRLIREIEASGGDAVDVEGVVAGGAAPGGAVVGVGVAGGRERGGTPADELAARRRRRRAEKVLADAADAVRAAERARDAADGAVGRAKRHVDELAAEVGDLEKRLVRARREADRARTDADTARNRADAAAADVRAASDALDAARADLDDLRPWGP